MVVINFNIPSKELKEMSSTLSFEEKVYNIVEKSFEKINQDGVYEKWDLDDIKEDGDNYVAVLKLFTKEDCKPKLCEEECDCDGDCQCEDNCYCEEDCSCDNQEELSFGQKEFDKSSIYPGPWENKTIELDVTQISALFELVQFCDYMIQRSRMITPSAVISMQELQKVILENLTESTLEQVKNAKATKDNTPLQIKLKDDFAFHLKKWQEESAKYFDEINKKPKIVTATMMPEQGFDPRGPGY